MDIGSRLKEARIEKDFTLDYLQETTKIQKRYLLAIEEGNFDVLPGKFYARAFIKEYAQAVGLDPSELVEAYKEDVPKLEDESEIKYSRMQRSRREHAPQEKSGAIFSLIPTIITVALVIGIIFAAYFFFQAALSSNNTSSTDEGNDNELHRTDNGTGQNPSTDDDNESDDNDGSGDTEGGNESDNGESNEDESSNGEAGDSELTLTEAGTGSIPSSEFEFVTSESEVTVEIEVSQDSWLDVKNEADTTLLGQIVTPAESPIELDLTGEERIRFNVGNAPGVVIKINGQELEYPVDMNDRVNQHLWVTFTNNNE